MLPSRVTSALHASLLSLGVSVHPAWVGPALQAEMATGELSALKSFVDGDNDAAAPMPPSLLAAARDALLARVLFSSLEQIGTRRLPIVAAGVAPEPRSMLRGLHVLQLVECVDVAHSLTELQEQPHRSDRSWKMQLTDGTGCVAAFERKRCSNLTPQVMQPGVKLALRDVPLRHGILMLEPGHIEVLGGGVPSPEGDDSDADAVAAVDAHLRQQQQEQETKQKEREEKQMAPQQQHQPQQGFAAASGAPAFASAAAASSFSAGRPVAPAAPLSGVAAAARGPFLPVSSAASSAALPPPYPFRSNVLVSSGAASAAAAASASSSAAAVSSSALPLPRPLDDDSGELDMIDEEGLAASWEAEEAERAAHQMPPLSGSSLPVEKPLLTAAELFTPEPAVAVIDRGDTAMIDGGDGGGGDASAGAHSQPSLPPLSQSMPALEMAPSILEMASPPILPPTGAAAAEHTPTAARSSATTKAAPAAMTDASAIPTLTPMSSLLLTPPAASSMMTDSPSTTAGTARGSAGASPASATTPASRATMAVQAASLSASSGVSAKSEPSGSSGGGGGGGGGENSRAPSPASSTSSDDCIVLGEGGDSGGPHHRAARSKHVKSEARPTAAAAASSSSSPAADRASTPSTTLREQLQSRKASGASTPPAFIPPEVSGATLSRALDACAENKTRLFPPAHPMHAYFASLPYTFVHLLRHLSSALPTDARPQHVLLEAQVQAIVHAELSPEYSFRVSLADALSGTTAALSPALVGKIVGCSATQLAALPLPAQDTLIDRIEAALQLQLDRPARGLDSTQLMQVSVAPNSVSPDGGWIAGKEPVVLDIRAITPEDRKQLDKRKAQIKGPKAESS